MVEIPQWFTSEVAPRLRKVSNVPGSLQHYACCPVSSHGDQHASMGIRPGDTVTLIYHCKNECPAREIREALAVLGVPDEYLGAYGTPEYEARKRARSTGDEWRQIERLRNEMADLKNGIRGLMLADLSLAMLKVRLLSVVGDVDIPTSKKEYAAFAISAGVSPARAYEAWKVDPISQSRNQCVSGDHVVLTQPGEIRQASQVTGHGPIPEPRNILSNREDPNSRNENSRNEKITGDEAA